VGAVKKSPGLYILLILGIIAFVFVILDVFALSEIRKLRLPRDVVEEMLVGKIVNISYIPIILFFLVFLIPFIRAVKKVEKKELVRDRLIDFTGILYIISFVFLILDYMALVDVGHDMDKNPSWLTMEWIILGISLIPFTLFFVSFFLTVGKILRGHYKNQT
jgi:hypothetical protein